MKASVVDFRLLALLGVCLPNILIYTACETKPVYKQPSYSFKSEGNCADERQSKEETMKYWEKALCGMYYVGGKSNAPCYITNIDGLLFATNENKETARLIVTPDLRVVVEAWHISGEPDQIPDILWNNGTWWSRSALNGFFIKTNVVSPGWERLSVQ